MLVVNRSVSWAWVSKRSRAYWLEMLVDSRILAGDHVTALVKEDNELLAMTVASLKTLREQKMN